MQPNPPATTESDDELRRIAREAAEWRARQDAGIDPATEAAFLRWLEADERHAPVFNEMDTTWRLLDRAREVSPAALGVASTAKATALRAHGTAVSSRRRFAYFVLPLAAAAAIAVIFGVNGSSRRQTVGEPAFTAAANADGGELKRVNLPDGSVVRLKANAAIVVNFAAGERRVRLVRGEAHFTVAKSAQPFVVAALGIDVRAVGTAFTVCRGEEAIEILVTEGKVGLESAATRESLLPARTELGGATAAMIPVLTAGERATVAMDYARDLPVAPAYAARVSDDEMLRTLAWQDRRIAFDDVSLAEIVAAFNRFNQHQIVIADEALARLRIGGSFRADDPDTFVHLIETRDGVVADRKDDQTTLRVPK